MATTQQKTTQHTAYTASPRVLNRRPGMVFFQEFDHVQDAAGDDGSSVLVYPIEAGTRLYLHVSTIRFSAFGASRVMKLGWQAYTDPDGTAVLADDDGIFAGLDVSAAGNKRMIEAPTLGAGMDANGTRLFQGSAVLIATVTGGTWPDDAAISGLLALAPGGP